MQELLAARELFVGGSVQTLSHIWFVLSGAPAVAYAVMAPSHPLVPQQLDVQISLGRPRGTGDLPEPGRGEIERRLHVGERAHDARAPPDLAQDALERICPLR